jgi:hypothetical protein
MVIQVHRDPRQSLNRLGISDNGSGRKQQRHADSGQRKGDFLHGDPPVKSTKF